MKTCAVPRALKTALFITLCSLSFSCLAQKKDKGFINAAFQIDMPEKTQGFGGRVSGGTNVNQALLIGVGAGFTKLENQRNNMIPLFAHFCIGDFNKKVFPYLLAEPGYGFYDYVVGEGPVEHTKGGFAFYGGAGLGVASGKKSKFTLTAGYSTYSFQTRSKTSDGKIIDRDNFYKRGFAFRIAMLGL